MMREYVERLGVMEQETFNNLAGHEGIADLCALLDELGVDEDKLKGAVYGWALNEAGLS